MVCYPPGKSAAWKKHKPVSPTFLYLCPMLKKFLYYMNPLTLFKKPDESEKANFNLRFMHGINRISIFMFLLCLLILFFRYAV